MIEFVIRESSPRGGGPELRLRAAHKKYADTHPCERVGPLFMLLIDDESCPAAFFHVSAKGRVRPVYVLLEYGRSGEAADFSTTYVVDRSYDLKQLLVNYRHDFDVSPGDVRIKLIPYSPKGG